MAIINLIKANHGFYYGYSNCHKSNTISSHWWIKNKLTGDIFDVTSEQYTTFGFKPPYDNGKPCSFLTKEPSKRAK